MNAKQIRYIVSVVISSVLIGLIFFYLFRYFRRHFVIRAQQVQTQQVDRDILELQALGFAPDSQVIAQLRAYKAELQGMIAAKEYCREDVLAAQKNMLLSYIEEAKRLRARKVDTKDSALRFAYDKMLRLSIAVAELQKDTDLTQDDFERRVDRMREITRQSITHYKKQLREYARRDISSEDLRVCEAREFLSLRIKHFYHL